MIHFLHTQTKLVQKYHYQTWMNIKPNLEKILVFIYLLQKKKETLTLY